MYESPITMYMNEIHQQIEEQQTEQLMLTVKQSIGYDVDKLELIKALEYDREQYFKGYRDYHTDMLDKVKKAREKISDWDVNKVMDGCSEPFKLGVARGLDKAVEILDKLITESEGNNEM